MMGRGREVRRRLLLRGSLPGLIGERSLPVHWNWITLGLAFAFAFGCRHRVVRHLFLNGTLLGLRRLDAAEGARRV